MLIAFKQNEKQKQYYCNHCSLSVFLPLSSTYVGKDKSLTGKFHRYVYLAESSLNMEPESGVELEASLDIEE